MGPTTELTMCVSTLLRDPIGACPPDEFGSALEATAEAGCTGISLWTLHAIYLEGGRMPPARIAERVAEAGLQVRIIEAATAWAETPDDEEKVRADAQGALELADALGADQLLATTMGPSAHPDAARGLALVGDLAADRGVTVGFEFLPWSAFPDLRSGWRLVQDAARSNVGLVLDVWHWERQPDGPDLEALAEVPADRIVGLQLDDVSPESDGDLLEETMASRRPPGEGVADIAGLLAVLEGARADPLVSLEVFNHALLIAEGPAGLARRVADGARRALGPL